MRSFTFSNANQYLDTDGIKTSIATVAAAISYATAALNGAFVSGGVARPAPNSHEGLAMIPSATASSSSGSYVNGSRVRFVGKWGSNPNCVRTATVVGTDGGATFLADGPLETVLEILVDAQVNTAGAWTFGFSGISAKQGQRIVEFQGQGDGNLLLDYGAPHTIDTLPTAVGRSHRCSPLALLGTSTAICTVYVE